MLFSTYDSNHVWIRIVDLVYLELLFCILDSPLHINSVECEQIFLAVNNFYTIQPRPQDHLCCCCRLAFQLSQIVTPAGKGFEYQHYLHSKVLPVFTIISRRLYLSHPVVASTASSPCLPTSTSPRLGTSRIEPMRYVAEK